MTPQEIARTIELLAMEVNHIANAVESIASKNYEQNEDEIYVLRDASKHLREWFNLD